MVAGTVAKTHGTKGEFKIVTDIKVKLTEWAFLEIREKLHDNKRAIVC